MSFGNDKEHFSCKTVSSSRTNKTRQQVVVFQRRKKLSSRQFHVNCMRLDITFLCWVGIIVIGLGWTLIFVKLMTSNLVAYAYSKERIYIKMPQWRIVCWQIWDYINIYLFLLFYLRIIHLIFFLIQCKLHFPITIISAQKKSVQSWYFSSSPKIIISSCSKSHNCQKKCSTILTPSKRILQHKVRK